MLKPASMVTLTAALLMGAAMSAPAMAQASSTASCPANYEPLTRELCIKASNGDVVLATPGGSPVTYTSADCRKGYEFMIDNLCIHPKWGDVVFVNERPAFAAASCRAGYEFLINGLCFNRQSGDIVFSEVKSGATLAAAKK